jgi:hypothetical protein
MTQDVNLTEVRNARENKFLLQVKRFEKVAFSCTAVSIGGVTLSPATQVTPHVDIPRAGDKLAFSPMSVRFLLAEDMSNYRSLYDWMTEIVGITETGHEFPFTEGRVDVELEKRFFSDMTVSVLHGNRTEAIPIYVFDAWPSSIDSVDFNTQSSGVLTIGAQFYFSRFDFRYD